MPTLTRFIRPAYHRLRRLARRSYAYVLYARYLLRNRFGRSSLLGDTPVVVSLTSYGSRVNGAFATIESIGAGVTRPRRIILWLDDPDHFHHLPEALRRLQRRGLEVRLTSNLGPHTKYYPALTELEHTGLMLVTSDDDIMYPRRWLSDLVDAHARVPLAVCCHRAFVVALRDGKIAPYASWPNCRTTSPSATHFATGVSGVLYPPAMLDALRSHGLDFVDKTLKADDVWLHWVALRAGILVHQIRRRPRHFLMIPGSQAGGLVHTNVAGAANDLWIAQVYDDRDYTALEDSEAPDV